MSRRTKLAFTAIIVPLLCQCMVQSDFYVLSENQTFFSNSFVPFLQVGNIQLWTNSIVSLGFSTIVQYNLATSQVATYCAFEINNNYTGDWIPNGNTIYSFTFYYHVLKLDSSMEQIADYGTPNLIEPTLANYNDGALLLQEGYSYAGPYVVFNTSTNQFTQQFYFQGQVSQVSDQSNPIFPYAEGYLYLAYDTDGLEGLGYYSYDGTVSINFGEVGSPLFLLNQSSIVIVNFTFVTYNYTALSVSQNNTGPTLLLEDVWDIQKVNDTHFVILNYTNASDIQQNITTLTLYTTNSDLEIIPCASLDFPSPPRPEVSVFLDNNSIIISSSSTQLWIDIEPLAISQILPTGIVPYPQMMLSNGSVLGFTGDGYYIFSGDTFVTFSLYLESYIDPSNGDFVWMLLDSSVLMIQISTSISETFPIDFNNDGWTLVSASYNGIDECNFTLQNETFPQELRIVSGTMQQTIYASYLEDYSDGELHFFVVGTNYQEGTLYYLGTSISSDEVYEEVFDNDSGLQISNSTLLSGSTFWTTMFKISDNYVIIANSSFSNSTEIYVYSFNESQFIYSKSFPVHWVTQISPLGIDLNSPSIVQGFAILSDEGQTYSAFDAQGNQLDSITLPSDYSDSSIQLRPINETSVGLMVIPSSGLFNYLSVYQYATGTTQANPQSSLSRSTIRLSPHLLGMLIVGYLIL